MTSSVTSGRASNLADADLAVLDDLDSLTTVARRVPPDAAAAGDGDGDGHSGADGAATSRRPLAASILPVRSTIGYVPFADLEPADEAASASASFITRSAPFALDADAPPSSETATPEFRATPHGAAGAAGAAPDYVLLERIGRGGQGEVWRAWQASLAREVAVKKLLDGDPEEFLSEAYTAAALDHPNIAPVHDLGRMNAAGGAADGSSPGAADAPLLAMKLVRGTPWDRLLRAERAAAPADDRDAFLARHLAILVDVANAVAYAHAHGIVHRDLKPAQVMVGDFGEVYLMDWGLAIWTGDEPRPTDVDSPLKFRTRSNSSNPAGTPAYMAPEQTETTTERIAPATDVYLLGAILHELLAGRAPHAARSARVAYFRAIANDVDPLPPDTPAELADLARAALATDPADRPASATEFRAVLEAYLTGANRRRESDDLAARATAEFAATGAPSRAHYRDYIDLRARLDRALILWPGNHRAAATRADLLAAHARAALAEEDFALAETLLGALEATADRAALEADLAVALRRRRRREAQRRLSLVATVALLCLLFGAGFVLQQREGVRLLAEERAAAEQERADLFLRAKNLQDAEYGMVRDLVRAFPPPRHLVDEDGATDFTAAATAVAASPDAERALLARRETVRRERAALLHLGVPLDPEPFWMGLADANRALRDASTPADWSHAADLYAGIAAAHPDALEATLGEGIARFRAGDLRRGAGLILGALQRLEREGARNDVLYPTLASLAGSAYALVEGSSAAGRPHYEAGLAVLEPEWARTSIHIGRQWRTLGDPHRGLEYTSAAVEVLRRRPDTTPRLLASSLGDLAHGLAAIGRYEDAEAAHREMFDLVMGQVDDPLIQRRVKTMLAVTLLQVAKHDEAVALLEASLVDLDRLGVGAEPGVQRLRIELTLASLADEMGDSEGALERFDHVVDGFVAYLGPEHPHLATAYTERGAALFRLARYDEAERDLRAGLAILEDRFGERHPDIALALSSLASVLLARDQVDEAEALYRRALAIQEDIFGEASPMKATALENLATAIARRGRYADALVFVRQTLAMRRQMHGDLHPLTITSIANLAHLLDAVRRFDEAEPLHREGVALLERAVGPDHPMTATLRNNLAANLQQQGRIDEALPLLADALRIRRASFGDGHPDTLRGLSNLAHALGKAGRHEEARLLFEDVIARRVALLGPDHPDIATSLSNLAGTLGDVGDPDATARAAALHARALRMTLAARGPGHPDAAGRLVNTGRVFESLGRPADMTSFFLRALDAYVAAFGEDDPLTAMWAGNALRGLLLHRVGIPDDRDDLLRLMVRVERDELASPRLAEAALLERVQWINRHQVDALLAWRQGAAEVATVDPAARALARRLMRRHAALAGLGAMPDDHERRVEFTAPRVAELDMAAEFAELEARGRDARARLLGPDGSIETAALLAWLDEVAAPIDWPTEFPAIDDWSLAAITPNGDDLAAIVDALVAELEAMHPLPDLAAWPVAPQPPIPEDLRALPAMIEAPDGPKGDAATDDDVPANEEHGDDDAVTGAEASSGRDDNATDDATVGAPAPAPAPEE